MEKLTISKELANEIKYWKGGVRKGIDTMTPVYFEELNELKRKYGFITPYQVSAYLLGGQERVYEVKNDPYVVVWNTENKDFYPLPYNYPLEEGVEIAINTYDIMEDAECTAQELNDSL